MIVLFLLQGDFTIRGYYEFFFYLVMVGFAEEFIFRGYVYNELLRHNKLLAVIVSGFFWGIQHAILPGVLVGEGLGQIGIRMLSHVGGGIAAGYYFIYLLEKSKSLFIPVFVHAILDYTVGGIGILTAIGTGVYLFILDRKNYRNRLDKESGVMVVEVLRNGTADNNRGVPPLRKDECGWDAAGIPGTLDDIAPESDTFG